MTGAAELAQRLNARPSGDGYIAHCPVPGHGQGRGDRSPSLSISEGADGKVLWKCHAGCSQEAVGAELGLNKSAKKALPEIVATFTYRDKDNKPLYTKRRYEPGFNGGRKSFLFEHGNGQKGRGGEAVLYNLPALVGADAVYIAEGEAKADLLSSWGLPSSCLDSGADSPFRPEYVEILAGKHIVILTDNDKPGRKHGEKIAAAMKGKAKSIKIIDLPGLPEKGDVIDWARQEGNNKARLLELIAAAPEWNPGEAIEVPCTSGLDRFILNGASADMEKKMLEDKHVLGRLALLGQSIVIYAGPGTGKTLITTRQLIDSIRDGVINGEDVFYINADDNHKGLTYKLKLAERWGFKMLAPSYYGFRAEMLATALAEMVQSGTAKGKIVILDTLKKFTDIMDKRTGTKFGEAIRQFVSHGGTVYMLAHVNKHKNADGKSIYSGTSDIVDDCDCAYTVDTIASDAFTKTVKFTNIKNRGDVAEEAVFRYSMRPGQSYADLLESVEEISTGEAAIVAQSAAQEELASQNHKMIMTILDCIREEGGTKKTDLITEVRERTGESRKKVLQVLNQHEGSNTLLHQYWTAVKGDNNHIIYKLGGTP